MFGGSSHYSHDLSPHVRGLDAAILSIDEVIAGLDRAELAAVERFLDRLERQGCISQEGAAHWRARLAAHRHLVRQS